MLQNGVGCRTSRLNRGVDAGAREYGHGGLALTGSAIVRSSPQAPGQEKYAATGGWGFGHFQDGKPSTDEAMMKTCFALT